MTLGRGLDAELTLTIAGRTVTLTGVRDGLETITSSLPQRVTRRVPGGGLLSSQDVGHETGRITFTMDANARTEPFLWMRTGRLASTVWRERGAGAGRREQRFTAIVSVNYVAQRGTTRRMEVTLVAAGAVTDTDQ